MNKQILQLARVSILTWGLVYTVSTMAAQSTVYGEVIEVEALTPATEVVCVAVSRPPAEQGLAALLTWDLQQRPDAERECRKRRAQNHQKYRVTYRYAGREFVDVLASDPGARIALTLELD